MAAPADNENCQYVQNDPLRCKIKPEKLHFTLLFIIPRIVLLSSIQPELKPSTSLPTHFREVFRKSSHHVNTNKGSISKQSGNDVEGCRLKRFCFNSICAYFCNTV